MEQPRLATRVRELINQKLESGESVRVPWIVQEIIEAHASIEGADKDFYLLCARSHVKGVVKACIGKYDVKAGRADEQLVLDGFQHLQVAYSVERDGETQLIPVDHLSNGELLERAAELVKMGNGCFAHAEEMRSYVAARGQENAA